MNTNAPSDLRLMDIFFQSPLGMDLPTTQFSHVKETLQLESISNTDFDADHTASCCQGPLA